MNDKFVIVANGNKLKICGIGTCNIQLKNEQGDISKGKLTKVLYVPDLKAIFISIRKLTENGIEVKFYHEKADISFNKRILTTATVKNDLSNSLMKYVL